MPTADVTVAEAARRWLTLSVSTRRKPADVKIATQRVARYLVPFLGGVPIAKLTGDNLRAFRSWIEKQPHPRNRGALLAPETVRHVLSDVRALCYWAEDSGLIDRTPFPRGLLPRVPERVPDRLDDEAVRTLVGLREPYGFTIRLGLGSALRWSDLRRVQASDVSTDGILTLTVSKTGKALSIPLPPELVRECRQRVGRLVPFKDGRRFNQAVRRLSGIERFCVKLLRSTFGHRWINAEGNLESLALVMGHSSSRITARHYARLGMAALRAEAERVYVRQEENAARAEAESAEGHVARL